MASQQTIKVQGMTLVKPETAEQARRVAARWLASGAEWEAGSAEASFAAAVAADLLRLAKSL